MYLYDSIILSLGPSHKDAIVKGINTFMGMSPETIKTYFSTIFVYDCGDDVTKEFCKEYGIWLENLDMTPMEHLIRVAKFESVIIKRKCRYR